MLLKDIKLILHERRMLAVLGMILAALCLGVLFAKPSSTGAGVRFGVADHDDSEYSRLLIAYFEESKSFSSYVSIVTGDEAELDRMLKDHELDLYLVIPKDFAERLMNIDNLPIKAVIDSSDKTKAVLYKNLLNAYGSYISAVEVNAQAVYDLMGSEGYDHDARTKVNYELSYDLIFTALGKDEIFKRNETERVKGVELANYYVYSLLMLVILYTGMLAGLGFLAERKSLASARLAAIGKGYPVQYFSKLVAYLIVCWPVITAMLLTVNASGRMHFDLRAILLSLTGLAISCAVFMAASLLPLSQGGYITLANMLILLLTIVGGGIIPIMYLPDAMARLAVFTPTYRFIRAML